MKRSDRIALIKKLCSRLAALEWEDIDLTLRQFDLPWSTRWQGEKYGYCLSNVEGASDEVLGELHEHLFDGKEFAGAILDESRGPWIPGRFRLFLTHLSKDKVFVAELKAGLLEYGIDAFVAHEDIDPTKEWEREIERALSTCDALAAYLTPEFHQSLWTDQEIGYCVRRRVLVVPIRCGQDPYGFIARYQAVPGTSKTSSELARTIFDVLVSHDLTAANLATAIIGQFEDSSTFADAKRNFGLLRSIRQWTSDLLQRVEQAAEQNDQIKSAWGVPSQIQSLVEQHRQ